MECAFCKSNKNRQYKNRQYMGLSIVLPTCLANIRTWSYLLAIFGPIY